MPRRADMASMGPDLRIGSLRAEMEKLACWCVVVAAAGVGYGSLGEVMCAVAILRDVR